MHTPIVGTDLNYFYRDFRNEVFALTKKLQLLSVKNPFFIFDEDLKRELPNIINKKAAGLEDAVKSAHQELNNFLRQTFAAVKFDSSIGLGLSKIQESKRLVEKFQTFKGNQDVEELYNIFREFNLNTTQVEIIKNIIECVKIFSDINSIINLEAYKSRIVNIPDSLNDDYQKLEADLQGKLLQYVNKEFQIWLKDFQENSKIELRNLDGVIALIKIFTEFHSEGNAVGAEFKEILINGYLTKFENLKTHLNVINVFTIDVGRIEFNDFDWNPEHYQNNQNDENNQNNQNNNPESGYDSEMWNLISRKESLQTEIDLLEQKKKELTEHNTKLLTTDVKIGIIHPNDNYIKPIKPIKKPCCSILTVEEIKFDNPLLNYNFLQTQIRQKFGFKALNNLIDLNLTADELDDAVFHNMFSEILGLENAD